MNCYDCDPKATPAVARCKLCGKGLCLEHCVRQERPVYERVPSGMTDQIRATGRRAPRMVCRECDQAVGVGDAAGAIERRR